MPASRSRDPRRHLPVTVFSMVPPCMAALYPLVFIVRSHSTTHLFGPEVILRPAGVLVVGALLAVLLFRGVVHDFRRASVAATLFFVLTGLFPVIFNVKGPYGSVLPPIVFVLAAAAIALLVARRLDRSLIVVISWTVTIAVAALGVATFVVSNALWPTPRWEPLVQRTIAQAGDAGVSALRRPDIYYVVLDGMGRRDVLERLYGMDVGAEVESLRAQGVQIPEHSRSNYSQTQLSLASALNMTYLSDLADLMGGALDRRPVNRLIVEAGVVKLLKAQGYEVVVVGPRSTITAQNVDIDRCLCSLPDGPTELEYSLFSITPARGRYLDRAGIAAHGRQVRRAFDLIESVWSDRPLFVISHIVSPHPPFALDADGSPRTSGDRFTYHDGDGYPGTRAEYVSGYRAQATYVLRRTSELVRNLTARAPDAVVVVHGDHGPGLGLVNTDASRTDAWERLAIFSAYYAGGRSVDVPDDISPVNALRWALNVALGSELELLANRSYLSSYLQPYGWIEIPPEARAARR